MGKLPVFEEIKLHLFLFCIIVQVQNPGLVIEYDVICILMGFFGFGGGGVFVCFLYLTAQCAYTHILSYLMVIPCNDFQQIFFLLIIDLIIFIPSDINLPISPDGSQLEEQEILKETFIFPALVILLLLLKGVIQIQSAEQVQ